MVKEDKGPTMERVEAGDLCAACGGYCCCHAPGKFSPDDLASPGALDAQAVGAALDSGRAVVYASFTNVEGSKAAPIFTLAARGVDRPPLSLCHEPARCAHLEGDRCAYELEERPFECAAMVPSKDYPRCGLPDDMVAEALWVGHQGLLRDVIEQRSGRPWREELIGQIESRRHVDAYAYGAFELVRFAGLAEDPAEADAIVAAWAASLD
jgi:hypothetical protein